MSATYELKLKVNGEDRTWTVDPDEKLLDVLRRHGYVGVKRGCGEATCGSCTVLLDGRAVFSCVLYAVQAEGREVTTIEALGSFDRPHPLQTAFADEGAVQCGFCIPGMILSAKAMLDRWPRPDDEQLARYMDGNLCRCTGYEKIETAIRRVVEEGA